MRISRISFVAAATLLAAGVSTAHAQVPFYEPGDIVVSVGGGVEGFTDGTVRDTASTGGAWSARVVFAARSSVALEAAYIGSAQPIDAFGIDSSALLVGNGAEGILRFQLSPLDIIQPYVFMGAAFRRYSIARTETNFSDLEDRDTVYELPMGGGVAYQMRNHLVLDARAQFRPAFDEDLMPASGNGNARSLHRWGVSANVGFSF